LVEVAGDAAIVVPRGDPEALAAGVSEALVQHSALSAAGRLRSHHYSWNASAEHTWRICRDLLM